MRGSRPSPEAWLVDAGNGDDVRIELRQEPRVAAVARHPKQVPPSVTLARPQERATPVESIAPCR